MAAAAPPAGPDSRAVAEVLRSAEGATPELAGSAALRSQWTNGQTEGSVWKWVEHEHAQATEQEVRSQQVPQQQID